VNDDRISQSDDSIVASPHTIEAATESVRVELGLGPDDLRRPEIRALYADEIKARAEQGR
jgi:hypothetical protein